MADNSSDQTGSTNSTKVKSKSRRRSNKQKAEDQFRNDAAPRTLDKFFSDVIEKERENVEMELHLDIASRLIDGYDDKIDSHFELQPFQDDKANRLTTESISDLKSMTNLAIAKKLYVSTPQSELTAVDHLKYTSKYVVTLPKSINIAIEQLGKVTTDEWICRIKWNSLTIERFLVQAVQEVTINKKFVDQYLSDISQDEFKAFQDINVGKMITSSNDSVSWLHEQSQEFLVTTLKENFEVKIGDQNQVIQVSYPHLEFSDDEEKTRANIIEWMTKINVNHPKWESLGDAAFLRLSTINWLTRRSTKLKDLDSIFAESLWQDRKLSEIFDQWKITHLDDHSKFKRLRDHCNNILYHYQKYSLPLFHGIFSLSTANSSSSFGSTGQLIVLDQSSFVTAKKKFGNYYVVGQNAFGESIFKVKDKSAIVHQSVFGFTKSVSVKKNNRYIINGGAKSVKASIMNGDFKNQ